MCPVIDVLDAASGFVAVVGYEGEERAFPVSAGITGTVLVVAGWAVFPWRVHLAQPGDAFLHCCDVAHAVRADAPSQEAEFLAAVARICSCALLLPFGWDEEVVVSFSPVGDQMDVIDSLPRDRACMFGDDHLELSFEHGHELGECCKDAPHAFDVG